MRKPTNPSHHTLADLSRAFSIKIGNTFPSPLALAGKKPKDWPNAGTAEFRAMVKLIKAGLAFYCIEDFLWPQGRQETPIEIWVGHSWRKSTRHLHKLGEQGRPMLAELLWTPRVLEVQPVALRTYDDALAYKRAGALLERRFLPSVTSQWRIRDNLLERAMVTPEFCSNYKFKQPYYFGDYPSRIAEGMAPELRYVLTAKTEAHNPPSAAYKNAFRRQLRLLLEAWGEVPDARGRPGIEWVRQRLLPPEYSDHSIGDGYADRYRKALLACIEH
jgi:hypothetical protein